jgi:hypothetical protein
MTKMLCPNCNHTLEDNNHGCDQNDFYYDPKEDTYKHSGKCTYCIYCNDRFKQIKNNLKPKSKITS